MRKRFAGIDIGSRSIELVVVDDLGEIVISLQTDTGFDPMTAAKDLIHGGQGKRHFPDGRGGFPSPKRGVTISGCSNRKGKTHPAHGCARGTGER